ncbi:hypothetical protein [Pendulispora albinea]|uniref:Uncharacterized protein n=1 Tax=Pendulispora albinea TaxID=2741071 RepID=A0ABZ2LQE1_9BACT
MRIYKRLSALLAVTGGVVGDLLTAARPTATSPMTAVTHDSGQYYRRVAQQWDLDGDLSILPHS